jgi:RNA polymerase sigma factor (sigma-70 family)
MTIAIAPVSAEDSDAFAQAIRPLLPVAHRLAYGMLQSSPEAEDAVQEAVLKAWRALHRLRAGSELRPWFLAIVANQCRQQRRSRWWSVVKRADMPETGVADPSPEAATDLRLALSRLSRDQRLALVLRYYLDLPFEEVGSTLGVSAKAAKSRVHRALGRLRVEVPEVLDGE